MSDGGVVAGVFLKPNVPGERGLPKLSAASIRVDASGVVGDYNLYRQQKRAGDPDMALLIMAAETLDALASEGWPIRPGDLGENILTRGIRYDEFAPPRRVRFGGAIAEISKPCDPCDNLYALPYVGRTKGPEFVRTMLGRRGWYARVIGPGEVRPGDTVRPDSIDPGRSREGMPASHSP